MLRNATIGIPLTLAICTLVAAWSSACEMGVIEGGTAGDSAEFGEIRTGNFPGPDGIIRAAYVTRGDEAVVGGDMIWSLNNTLSIAAAGSAGPLNRWSGGIIPYEFAPSFRNAASFNAGVAAWNAVSDRTGITLAKRTNESDYLYIISGLGCSSRVGHRGGKQQLSLADGCDAGAGIHEIGHAIGLIHEHARPKRDDFIRVEWSNIVGGENGFFAKGNLKVIQGAPSYSDYDPYSVMHYKSRFGGNYLVDPNKPWFTSKIAGVSESQFGSNTLSAGDIAGVTAMYQGFGGGTPDTGNENTCAVATCGQYSLAEGECKALTTGTFKCTGGCLENTSSCGTGTGTGASDEFTCQDGSKVPASYRCDNWSDCLDQSDEANCGVAPGAGLGTCQAAGLSGDCIDTNATTCAGQLHSNACNGLSNIRCCTASGAPTPPGNNSPEFTCANGEKIPLDYKCDSIQDCSDNSDESDATCPIPPGENAPSTDYGSCEVAGQPGDCIDTNATNCLGQLHSNACSGPNNIRCCT